VKTPPNKSMQPTAFNGGCCPALGGLKSLDLALHI